MAPRLDAVGSNEVGGQPGAALAPGGSIVQCHQIRSGDTAARPRKEEPLGGPAVARQPFDGVLAIAGEGAVDVVLNAV
jgi:hypothetical protein